VTLPDDRRGDPLSVSWMPEGADRSQREKFSLDPATGQEIAVRETSGGFFLYRMHFDLHYMPVYWARYLACIAALSMLVAILSGVVTHKKIFTDFFLLRFGKGQRSWLDAHNVTAVLALPFYLMITYTGLVTLLFTLMPWAITASFGTPGAFFEASSPPPPKLEAAQASGPRLPLSMLVASAERSSEGMKPAFITIRKPGDPASPVEIWPQTNSLGGERAMIFLDGATGEILHREGGRGGAKATQQVMINLHAGRFSGPMLRWLYFLSGVGGTIMVATGLVLWTVKRRAKLPDPARPHFGFRLVERLNIGFIAGAPAGIACYFLANRLLPLDMAHRSDWEVNLLFIGWGALFVWSIGRPAKQAWVETLTACATLYALVPLVNAATTSHGLVPSLFAGDRVFVTFDLLMLVMAAACAFTARKVLAHQPKAAPRRRAAPTMAEAGA